MAEAAAAEIKEYELGENFQAPRINLRKGEAISYKPFLKGAKVKCFLFDGDGNMPQTLITEDKQYAIPMRVIAKPATGPAAKVDMDLPLDARNRLNAIKSNDIVGNIVKNSQNSVSAAFMGAFAGLLFGLATKRSPLGCAAAGGIGGGILGFYLSKKNQKEGTSAAPLPVEEVKIDTKPV